MSLHRQISDLKDTRWRGYLSSGGEAQREDAGVSILIRALQREGIKRVPSGRGTKMVPCRVEMSKMGLVFSVGCLA